MVAAEQVAMIRSYGAASWCPVAPSPITSVGV
jgi:hypothetical protein